MSSINTINTCALKPTARSRVSIAVPLAFSVLGLSEVAGAKPFMDYIKPRPVTCSALSSETWGVDAVLPRDLCNGIESARGAGVPPEYYYWDGQILKAQDGKYHMFMSTWSGADGFNPGWLGSDAFHAVSDQGVLGPYQRDDYVYTNNGSHKGHNVSAVELPDGTYAVVVSETVPFTIYTSSSLDGPWTSCSPQIEVSASNVSLFPRHDGRFQVVERYGNIAIADTLCGTYVKQKPTCSYPTDNGDTIYPTRDSIPGVSNPTFDWQEDPHIWRSGGTYHVIYSGSGDRVGWHLYSADGITDWQDNGYAWSPREYAKLFCFEGTTTCTQWYKMERPGVVLEDGHPTHITWAVSDVDKDNQIPGNSNHGSKIIVVPFDGEAFDADFGDGSVADTGGAGGTGGVGGTSGTGTGGAMTTGSAGTGGLQVTGGVSSTGGASAGGASAGGASGTGATTPTASGLTTSGTTTATTGAMPSTSGTMSSSTSSVGTTSGSGGAPATSGTTATGGSSDSLGMDASSDESGCSCHVAGERSNSHLLPLLGIVGLVGVRARRRRKSIPTPRV